MAAKQLEFNFLTWEIDTTGRYLLDEICHISAHHQNSSFDEYIMPHRNITYSSSRKIQLYTLSIGMYRSLRKLTNGMVIKTNTEIVSLNNFINWLDKCGTKPVVLMCYEPYEYSPFILLQALKRYELIEKFKSVVYGFANVYAYIKKKCKKSVSSMSLRTLAKILLNKNNIKCLDSQCRAELVNEILAHLSEDSENPDQNISQEMLQYVCTVDEVDERLCTKLVKRDVQSSLKPIFLPYLKEFKHRRRALVLRNLLTYESSPAVDYMVLKTMWSKGPEEFKKAMLECISGPATDINDLIGIVSYHFQNIGSNSTQVTLPEIELSKISAIQLDE
ncbi:maternal protein exuperantia [Halyomorpha halys]|uniref:maternal protein exuperantia n=1 Tax=Halyomorpha halys TaxID=286706 RepID=UPI0006D51F9A|nr:maternal protein exuperantia [Halyomorpha halys]